MTLLPYLNFNQAEVFLLIRDYAPESVAMLIEDTLNEILKNRNGGLLSIGALATVWSASKGMNALTKALNPILFHRRITFLHHGPWYVSCLYCHANRCTY